MPADLSTWYHKLIRQKGTVMVVIPATVAAKWDKRSAHYAKIHWEGEGVTVEPLTNQMQPCFPAPAATEPPHRG